MSQNMETELLDVHRYRQLFLDDHALEVTKGVVRRLHSPERQGPVLRPDRTLNQTMVQSSSVPQWNPDKNLLEWWYSVFYDAAPYQGPGSDDWGDVHYATSVDGIDWRTPSLGLYEWRGSLDNNLAYHSKIDYLRRRGLRNPVDIGERRLHHIIRDDRESDPKRRYKALFSDGNNSGRYPAFSPDGFKWEFPHVPGIYSEDTSHMFYDEYNARFVATVKRRTEWGRSVWLSTSQDFINWTEPVLVLHTDKIDQTNRRLRINDVVADSAYLTPPHVDEETDFIAQLYLMPIMPYEGQYVGFPLLLNPSGLDIPQMNHVGLNQTELAVSKDLHNWERVADRAIFLGIEPWDGRNYGTCQVSVCGRPIVYDDAIWIYFEACRFRGVPSSYPPEYTEYFNDMAALELGKLRLDGFVSMDSDQSGNIITKPFIPNVGNVNINVDCQNGSLRAELLDAETFEPLPGFTVSDCNPVTTDDIRAQLSWTTHSVLDIKKPVRLKFEMNKSKLYSFWMDN